MAIRLNAVIGPLAPDPYLLAAAVVADLAIGDPVYAWHPIRLVGRTLTWLEDKLRAAGFDGYGGGVMLFIGLATTSLFVVSIVVGGARLISIDAARAVHAFVLYSLLALGDLLHQVWKIESAVRADDLPRARRAVSVLVGRDTDCMDAGACRRAAVESLSENLADGFVSPVFWYVLAGLPGLVVFKVVSTMDSMVGYKTARYLRFGWCGARLDDAMNYVPARLTWLVIVAVAALLPPYSGRKAWAVGLGQHALLLGPNSGWSEAGTAGALERRIVGPIWREGRKVTDLWVGDPRDPPLESASDVARAIALALAAGLVVAAISVFVLDAVGHGEVRGTVVTGQTLRSDGRVFIRSERWLDVAAGELRGPLVVEVVGDRIARMIPAGDFNQIPDGSLIDLRTATLMPGLIDAHVHLQIGGSPEANAVATLRAGFTTVVDLGATSDVVLRLRDRIREKRADGPRILAAGRWVGTRNGICEFGGIGVAGGPQAFGNRAQENLDAGADVIKVCVSTWLADAFTRPDAYEIQDEALAAVVETSHRSRRPVLAHAISLGSVKAALRAQVDGLAHGALIDDATAVQLRERGVFMIPTLASLAGAGTGPAGRALRAAVAAAHKTGVRIVFGTDAGVVPHGENASEFAAMVDAGIPAADAIRSATIGSARTWGLDEQIGTLAAGRVADIIAVDGDPLTDVRALSKVLFVMHEGRIVRR